MSPKTLQEFHQQLSQHFSMEMGPPKAFVFDENSLYVCFCIADKEASVPALIEALWKELVPHIPASTSAKLPVLFWRQRVEITEWKAYEDGLTDWELEAPRNAPEYLWRKISCRVWWQGLLPEHGKREGERCKRLGE